MEKNRKLAYINYSYQSLKVYLESFIEIRNYLYSRVV